MVGRMTEEEQRKAEQIVLRWVWAAGLSVPADRMVEQNTVGAMAILLLRQLLREQRADGQSDAA